MQIPRRRTDALRKIDNGPVYLTEQALERMKERLERLKKSIPDLAAEAGRQAAMGDRSENDGYKEAKSLLRRTHRQIYAAEDELKRAVVIKKGLNDSNTVRLGSTVVLEIGGVKKTYEILGSKETNPTRGRISHTSPLGAALLGHAKNDEIIVKTANGERTYRILEIR